MDVKHSRRILILGPREARILDLVTDLTGSAPRPDESGSIAGLIHEWNVKTAYYTAKIPIWTDELADPDAWKAGFLEPEAKEVVHEIGAWVYCFLRAEGGGGMSDETVQAMRSIQEVIEKHSNYGPDTVRLAVAMPKAAGTITAADSQEEQEDICMEYGMEYIDYGSSGINEFGEKTGLERLKEALEANEWTTDLGDDELDLDAFGFDADDGLDGLDRDEAEWTAELFDAKASLHTDDGLDLAEGDGEYTSASSQAAGVDDLDRMLAKLLAVKEESAGLPEAQRKKNAAKAVEEIMKKNSSM